MPSPINIGPKQRRLRAIVGAIGALVTAGTLAAVWLLKLPAYAAALTFVPAFVAMLGWRQAATGT